MSDESIESRLKRYIEEAKNAEIGFAADELRGKHLINDLAMDSLDIINMLFQIEENEGVDISEEDMERESLFEFSQLADHVLERSGD